MCRRIIFAVGLICFLFGTAGAGEIHDAVRSGNLESVKSLISQSKNLLEERNESQMTPFLIAASEGQLEILKYLKEAGADLSAVNNRRSTALHVAAFDGRTEVVTYLLKSGFDIDALNAGGFTPLMFAVYRAHPETARVLLDSGADKMRADNTWGGAAIHWASNRGNRETMELLKSYGYDLDMQSVTDSSTPLLWAANAGNAETLEYLLEQGVDPNTAAPGGWSALHNATAAGRIEIVKILIAHGADIHITDDEGNSAFTAAVSQGHMELIAYYLDNGIDVNERSQDNLTPLHWATVRGNTELVRLLLEKGADVNIVDDHLNTPLSRAVGSNDLESVRMLIEHGAEINVVDENGLSLVMRAVNTGSVEIVELLLANKAKVDNRENHYSQTELHRAAVKGYGDIAKMLIEAGADINAEDRDNHRPVYYADKYGNAKVTKLLMKQGAKGKDIQGQQDLLHTPIAQGDAVVWYLGHCGFAIKTAEHVLIFDYWNRGALPDEPNLYNGHIDPKELAGQNVTVFVSHDHMDHYDTAIYAWADQLKNISFVYGFNAAESRIHADSGYHGPVYEYMAPREQKTINGMNITTMSANDAGVGFVIEVDGVTLYHAGDHAGWREGHQDGFTAEIDFLAERFSEIDFAFMNVTGCHTNDSIALEQSIVYTLEKLHPHYWFPTHGSDREYVYKEFSSKQAIAAQPCEPMCAENRGDRFIFRDGRAL